LKKPLSWHSLNALKESDGQPLLPVMATLCISAGRKDKLRPGDILGALTGVAGLTGAQVGKIAIFDYQSYVAVERLLARQTQQRLEEGKVKGRSLKVRVL
jgi:ATP-independent RNA helicase DbpA